MCVCVCRRGYGKLRRLEMMGLWLQREVAEGKLAVGKIPGQNNLVDLMTKILSSSEVVERSEMLGMSIRGV